MSRVWLHSNKISRGWWKKKAQNCWWKWRTLLGKNNKRLACFSIHHSGFFFFVYPIRFAKGHSGTCKGWKTSTALCHPEKLQCNTNNHPVICAVLKPNVCWWCRAELPSLFFPPHVLSPAKKKKNRKLGMWFLEAIIFLAMDDRFSLAAAADSPLHEICPTDCISQTALWLTASLTATGSQRKTVKDERVSVRKHV